jgi:diguanylate cyclase (GGDEF)-like protein
MSDRIEQALAAEPRFDTVNACLQAMEMPLAFETARAALSAAREPTEIARAQYWLAKCRYVAGEIDVAIVVAAEACAAAAKAGDSILLARAQTIEARCLDSAGESDAALDLSLMALQELERAARTDDEARAAEQAAVTALGVVYLRLGDLPLAMEWCQRGVELARTLPDQSSFGAALDTLGCVHSALASQVRAAGDPTEAEHRERMAIACSTDAVDVALRLGHVDYETSAMLNLAESLTLVGAAEHALGLLGDWQRRHPAALPRQRSHHLDSLGQVYLAIGRAQEGLAAFEEALQHAESDVARALLLEHLSLALEQCGRWREALSHYKAFHALQARISTERAQRSARVAAARPDMERERARVRHLSSSNTELRRRAEDLARQANEDALTGLPNRRQVDALLAKRSPSVSVALVDVDHFKRVNDTYSHAVGDLVLKQLAAIMRDNCRPSDLAARMGGEEFLMIFDANPDAAGTTERLRKAVEAFDWPSLASGLRVTVSIGLARADEAAGDADLLSTADRRLYAAKDRGRNCIVCAD